MASASKYANLPDIDTAPDVYETPDVPLDHNTEHDLDSDSEQQTRANSPSARRGQLGNSPALRGGDDEAIDGRRMDPGEARRRFGNAKWDRRGGQSTSRRLPSTSVYTTGDDAPESALDKLRRLRLEVDELELQVLQSTPSAATPAEPTSPTVASATDSTAEPKRKKGEVTPAVLLKQVQLLRTDLNQPQLIALEREVDGKGAPGEEGDVKEAEKAAKTTGGLLAKLGLGGADATDPNTLSPTAAGKAPSRAPSPSTTTNPGELERRLAALEKAVGASEAEIDDAHPVPPPLLSTLSRLEHLLTLLTQPRHLDSISRRVKVLVSELERLHESRRKLGDSRPLAVALGPAAAQLTVAVPGGGPPVAIKGTGGGAGAGELPPDALQRLEALFTLLPRIDPLLPLTPKLLARLQSLASLHSSAAEFGATLTAVQGELGRLSEGEQGLKEVLGGVQRSVEENARTMGGNLASLEERVREVGARMAKLGV